MTIHTCLVQAALVSVLVLSCGGGRHAQPVSGSAGGSSGVEGGGASGFRGDPGQVNPPDTPVDGSCANVLTGPYDDSLEVPTLHWVESDDYSARFDWAKADSYYDPDITQFDTMTGFRLCWGPAGQPPVHGALFAQRLGQVFGVQNGVSFEAYIQSVDAFGHVSRPRGPVPFTGDPSRVDALSRKMTAFFDDFNDKGLLDELRWTTAFSQCNDPAGNLVFVTDDLHAVTIGGTDTHLPNAAPSFVGCDRVQVIAKPRALFDFTDREGIIAFDFDASFGTRESWYVDVFPEDVLDDITSHVTFGPGGGHPGRFLRFSQSLGDTLIIHYYDQNGDPVPSNPETHDFHFTNADVHFENGVMRHWELHVAKDHEAVYIDGEQVYEVNWAELGAADLDFTRGYVEWVQFGYNPNKEGLPWVEFKFDNFGFDGAANLGPVVHTYPSSFDSRDQLVAFQSAHSVSLSIPDSLAGASAARLKYTIQNPNYAWDPSDSLTINGRTFPIPEAKPVCLGAAVKCAVPDVQFPYQQIMPLDPSVLVQGTNDLVFSAKHSLFMNFRAELDFAVGSEPAFTQPSGYLPGDPIPTLPIYGPTARFSHVDDNTAPIVSADLNSDEPPLYFGTFNADGSPGPHQVLQGIARIGVHVDNKRPVILSGRNLGVSKVVLEVDGAQVDEIDTAIDSPTPATSVEFRLDTTQLTNGDHTLYARAYDSGGVKGHEYYDKGAGVNGASFMQHSVTFTVGN